MSRLLALAVVVVLACTGDDVAPFGAKTEKPAPIESEPAAEPAPEPTASMSTRRRRAATRMRRPSPFLEEGAPLDCGERPAEIAHPGFTWRCSGGVWRQVTTESRGPGVRVRAR